MEIKYTTEDLFVLKEVIYAYVDSFAALDFYEEVLSTLRKSFSNSEHSGDEIKKILKDWLFRHNQHSAHKVYFFLFNIAFDNVALEINNPELLMYVMWRLKIAK